MPGPLRYLSEEWAEAALAALEADPAVQEATKGLQVSLLSIVLHAPADCYGFLYVAFDGDGLADYRVGHDFHAVTKGISAPTFVVSGEYDVYAAIQRGELTERRAILTGRLHLTGSVVRALRLMRTLETITTSLRSIVCST